MRRRSILSALATAALFLAVSGCASPESRAFRGDEYARRGQYSLALREYQVARRKDPALFDIDQKIHNTQVFLYLQQGDQATDACRFSDAERAYGEVRRLEPGHPDIDARFERMATLRGNWHFDRGQSALTQGNPTSAIQEFEQALIHRPDHPRAAEALARAERELASRRDRADQVYEDGIAARDGGDLEEAIRRFEEALRLDPNHSGAAVELESAGVRLVAAWIDRGDAAARDYAWGEALDHYEHALERAPRQPGLRHRVRRARLEVQAEEWITAGDTALDQRDWARAYECFDHARTLSAEPERFIDRLQRARDRHAEELFAAAQTAEREGRYDDALAGYHLVIEFHPGYRGVQSICTSLAQRLEDADFAYTQGCASLDAGNLIGARERFNACVESVPGYLDAAERLRMTTKNIDLADSLYERACLAQRDGKVRRARVLFEECLALTRPFRDVDERLGATRSVVFPTPGVVVPGYEEGCRAQAERDFVRAVNFFERCESSRPGFEDVATRLGDLRNSVTQARSIYQQAVKAEERCDLASARDGFRQCLEVCTPFEDARERLTDLDNHLSMLRTAERLDRRRDLVAARELYMKVAIRYNRHPVANRRVGEIDLECVQVDKDYQILVEAQKNGRHRDADPRCIA